MSTKDNQIDAVLFREQIPGGTLSTRLKEKEKEHLLKMNIREVE